MARSTFLYNRATVISPARLEGEYSQPKSDCTLTFVNSFIIHEELRTCASPSRNCAYAIWIIERVYDSSLLKHYRVSHQAPHIMLRSRCQILRSSPKHAWREQRGSASGEPCAVACISRVMGPGRSCQASFFTASMEPIRSKPSASAVLPIPQLLFTFVIGMPVRLSW